MSEAVLYWLLFFPSSLVRRSRTALEGPVRGRQGSNCRGTPLVLRVGGDSSQQAMASGHQGRASQQDVLWCIRLLATHHAEGVSSVLVRALLALPGWVLLDPVAPLG